MYVIILTLIALPAVAALFHWSLHTFGYGMTGLACVGVLVVIVVIFEGRW